MSASKISLIPVSKSEKSKVFDITVKFEKFQQVVTKTIAEIEELYSSLKKVSNSISTLKIPHKKLFMSTSELSKQRIFFVTEFLKMIEKSSTLIAEDITKQFFNLKTSGMSKPGDDDNVDLGEKQNTKAKPSDFEFLKVIGKGSFGQVYLAKHNKEDMYYAIKVLLKKYIIKKNETQHIMSEKSILTKSYHFPFLMNLYYSFQTKEKLYFVLSYVNGGELFYHLQKEKSFSESRVKFYASEIGLALAYLHSNNIIYRDLKPENILLDKFGHIVLTDFGLSKEDVTDGDKTSTFCGTPEYLAPEILLKKPYDKSVDWWCLGCVMHELLFGLPPFYSRELQVMYNAIVNQPLSFKSYATPTTKSILEGLLCKDYKIRLGSGKSDFEEIKKHLFFKDVNWDAILNKTIVPEFVPVVSSDFDTTNVDVEFTRESLPESLIPDSTQNSYVGGDDLFEGFTYVQKHDDDNES